MFFSWHVGQNHNTHFGINLDSLVLNDKVPLHSSLTQGIVIFCNTDIQRILICLTLSNECSIKMFNAWLYLSIHQCILKSGLQNLMITTQTSKTINWISFLDRFSTSSYVSNSCLALLISNLVGFDDFQSRIMGKPI